MFKLYHKKQILLILTTTFACIACDTQRKVEEPKAAFEYADNIKFNHLYVAIDDSTYKYLFDSIPFFRTFAYVEEAEIDAGEDAWSGKYVSGNQDYLEIFRPGGAEGVELGDFGIAFMPNKLGVVDSLYSFWNTGKDSIRKELQKLTIGEGNEIPWFNAVAIYDADSLAISPWVMEQTRSFRQMAGFSEEELEQEISYAEYTQRSIATRNNIPYDSARYQRLYERVTRLSLQLTQDEYSYLSKYLRTFEFQESEGTFSRPDLIINYEIKEAKNSILNQIDFELRDEVEPQNYSVGNLTFSAEGRSASILFNKE